MAALLALTLHPTVHEPAPEPVPEAVDSVRPPDADSAVAWILAGRPAVFPAPAADAPLRRIAHTVRATAEWYDVSPTLIARMIAVESGADSAAVHRPITVSVYGQPVRTRAVGLGGIVPELWLGVFPECGQDLRRVRDNVCHTVQVYRWFRARSPDDETALLAYNGCRRGWPCDWYADAILEDF